MKNIQAWFQSYRATVLCFLLLIILLLATVVSFNSMFRSTMDALMDQSGHLNSVSTSQMRTESDFAFSSAFELISMINTNQQVQHFASSADSSSSYEHYDIYELSKTVSMYSYMVQSNRILSDFAVYYPNKDVLVNRSAYYRTDSYYNLWYGENDISFEEWKAVISSSKSGIFVPEASNSKVLVYIQSIGNAPTPGANTILFFDRNAIISMLESVAQENYHVALLLDGMLISQELPEDLSEALYHGDIRDTGNWNISRVRSSTLRSVSYYICENAQLQSRIIPGMSLKRFYSIAIVLLVIIAVSAVGLTLFSILLPVVRKYKTSYAANKSGRSTTVLKDAIEFVFSRNQDAPSDSEWLVVKDSLLDLLVCSESTHDKTLDTLHKHNIVFGYPYFLIALFTLSSTVPPDIFTALSGKCNDKFGGQIVNACFPIGNGRFTSLFNLRSKDTPYMGAVELIKEGIQECSDAEITIYIGSIQIGSTNIYQSYRDAVSLYEYKIFTGGNSTLDHNSFNLSSNEYYYPMDVELSLISAISRGDKDKVSQILKNIHDENFVNRQLSPDIAKLLLNELAGTTMKITRGMDSGSYENPTAKVLKCKTVEDVFYTLQCIYLSVCGEHKSGVDSKKKSEFKDYILQNYTDSAFSQSQMADDFGVSQNYLSIQFKNYFGVNMNAYVNALRVERAAEYLKNTGYSIQDIAVMCGFSNGDALARVFKKKYGVTPSDYRNGTESSRQSSSSDTQEGIDG